MVLREAYDVLPSTQTRAIELARQGAPVGSRVVALTQTAGKGRLGHTWTSPRGGVYLSIILPPSTATEPLLCLAIGVDLLERFEARYGAEIQLRWPNDLVHVLSSGHPAKLAGILADAVAVKDGGQRTVVGIGVNVDTSDDSFPSELRGRATSLARISTAHPTVPDVESDVVESVLVVSAEAHDSAARARWIRAARRKLYGLGLVGTVEDGNRGRISGVGIDGSLELDGATGLVRVRSGEVTVEVL